MEDIGTIDKLKGMFSSLNLNHSPKLGRRTRNFVLFFPIILANISCEGYRTANGVVKDAITHLPLDSVLVAVDTGNQEGLTDSSGAFDVHNRMAGCMFGCKDITVSFSKRGYAKKILTNPNPDTEVLLER